MNGNFVLYLYTNNKVCLIIDSDAAPVTSNKNVNVTNVILQLNSPIAD